MTSKTWNNFVNQSSTYTEHTSIDDFNYAVNISLKNKYIYIETPKVACSTVKITLQDFEIEQKSLSQKDFEVIHDRAFSPLLKVQQIENFNSFFHRPDYFKFCFVRNPYTRLLSAYLDKIAGNSNREKTNILLQMGYKTDDISINISFEQFISTIEQQSPQMMNNHWRHQYYCTYQNAIDYDFIGKLESFNQDFLWVLGKLGATDYYKQESRHATDSKDKLAMYYTNDLQNRVYSLYQLDFETFGYSKNL